eukprot:495979-Hanusia_phi.AAC.2
MPTCSEAGRSEQAAIYLVRMCGEGEGGGRRDETRGCREEEGQGDNGEVIEERRRGLSSMYTLGQGGDEDGRNFCDRMTTNRCVLMILSELSCIRPVARCASPWMTVACLR